MRHDANRGVGGAIVTGYRRVLALGVDVAVVMAGDGQMDPADLPALLDPIADGRADYVKGNRFRRRDVWREMPPTRIVGNVVLSLATSSSPATGTSSTRSAATPRSRARARGDRSRRGCSRATAIRTICWRACTRPASRVVDVPVRPIYGPAWKSGIRLATVVHPIPWVLASRVRASRARRVAGRAAARAPRSPEAASEAVH